MERIYSNQEKEQLELEKRARKKVIKLKSFYTHTLLYVIGLIIFFLKEYAGIGFNFFPLRYINCFVMAVWTIAFLVLAVDIFASYKIFGEQWEERKVKSILEKKVKNQKWE